jgi:hypothetical protein
MRDQTYKDTMTMKDISRFSSVVLLLISGGHVFRGSDPPYAQVEDVQLTKTHEQSIVKLLPRSRVTPYGEIHNPDSCWVLGNMIKLGDDSYLIPLPDLSKPRPIGETDLFLYTSDSLIDLNPVIKKARRGCLSYFAHDSQIVVVNFEVFLPNIDEIKIHSDSPPFSRIFDFSELWLIYLSDGYVRKLDEEDYEYDNPMLRDGILRVDLRGDGKKELYIAK